MRNFYFVSLVAILISLCACNNVDESSSGGNQIARFYWNQTKCSDPWNTGENDANNETEISVKAYLENESIEVENLDFDTNSPLDTFCESCGCGTGQRIIVDIMSSDISKMEALDFYQ